MNFAVEHAPVGSKVRSTMSIMVACQMQFKKLFSCGCGLVLPPDLKHPNKLLTTDYLVSFPVCVLSHPEAIVIRSCRISCSCSLGKTVQLQLFVNFLSHQQLTVVVLKIPV